MDSTCILLTDVNRVISSPPNLLFYFTCLVVGALNCGNQITTKVTAANMIKNADANTIINAGKLYCNPIFTNSNENTIQKMNPNMASGL